MLHIDYETSSEAELTEVGLYNYVTHKTTKILCLAYAFGDGEIKIWFPHLHALPKELDTAFRNPDVEITAFNSAFERYVTKFILGYDIPVSRWQDPQASARYLSLPANLEAVGEALGLPPELAKDKRGEALLELFSYPKTYSKKERKANPSLPLVYFNDHNSHPEDFLALGAYCAQDVRAEREVIRRESLLGVFPLPPRERMIWILDQKINDRGMPVDRQFIINAFDMASRNKEEKKAEQNRLTGLKNANSVDQLLPWVRARGYPLSNLRKQNVELVLKDPEVQLTDECRLVLNHKMEASSTSYTKLETMMLNINHDDVIRNMLVYMGSSRCGRWSGAKVQPHNFARPDDTFEKAKNRDIARALVYALDYVKLKQAFLKDKKKLRNMEEASYSPLMIVKNLIRTVFVAPAGKRFNVCDLNAIETRVGAWVAQCQPLLDVFLNKRDPYLDFAMRMYNIPYERLAADMALKKKAELTAEEEARLIAAKFMRQIAKPGVLGAVYRMGAGKWETDPKTGDRYKSGLWGYAEGMGVDMTQKQAEEVVKIFRQAYKEIVDTWGGLEDAVQEVLEGKQTVRYIGPDKAIKIDKLTFGSDEHPRTLLRIHLPSGRALHYMDASMQMTDMPWMKKYVDDETGEVYEANDRRLSFTYYGANQKTKQWSQIKSHGGKIFENIVQAIARDLLAESMLTMDAAGAIIVGHVHDEVIVLSDDDAFSFGVHEMEQIMNTPVKWAPSLPLGSEGFEDYYYHK